MSETGTAGEHEQSEGAVSDTKSTTEGSRVVPMTRAEAEALAADIAEPWYSDELPLAHVYPQFVWHCEAKIIANPAALRAIAAGALAAIETGGASVPLTAIDGEGYCLEVERTNSTGLRHTRLPYIADIARCNETDYASALRSRIAELEAALLALKGS